MLVFESMIHKAAKDAGMKVPTMELLDAIDDEPTWTSEDFPHFRVFCAAQLGRRISQHGQHWDNAKVIAAIPDDEIKTVTFESLLAKGLQI